MQRFARLRDAQRRAEEEGGGARAFAEELPPPVERQFLAGTFADVWGEIAANPQNAAFHEVIDYFSPCKLFFDVEFDWGGPKAKCASVQEAKRAMATARRRILEGVPALLRMNRAPHVVFDASRDGKQSQHIIFGVVLPSLAHVHEVATRVVDGCAQTSLGVDFAPYVRHNGTMRMPYCAKLGKPQSRLVPFGESATSPPNAAKFFAGCVAHGVDADDVVVLHALPQELESEATARLEKKRRSADAKMGLLDGRAHVPDAVVVAAREFNWGADALFTLMYAFESQCKATSRKFNVSSVDGGVTIRYEVRGGANRGLLCPNAEYAHSSNCTYVTVGPLPHLPDDAWGFKSLAKRRVPVTCTCSDPVCKLYKWDASRRFALEGVAATYCLDVTDVRETTFS